MSLLFKIGFLDIRFLDLVDILAVSFLVYQLYKLVSGSVAFRILLGFLFIYGTYLAVRALEMDLLSTILGRFIEVGVIAILIIFQQEIRKFLILLGRSTFLSEGSLWQFFSPKAARRISLPVQSIVDAAKGMATNGVGALMVFSKEDDLKEYEDSGDKIDALVSKRLLLALFNKNSPLHDGAVIIKGNRIVSARCILPVTDSDLPAQYGLRHRAAMGLTERTDALVLIVSEETGQISTTHEGQLYSNLSAPELRSILQNFYSGKRETSEKLVLRPDMQQTVVS